MYFATTCSLDLINVFKECRYDSMAGFVLLHLCVKTENLAFNKNQFNTLVFAFDLKCSKPNNLSKLLKIILHLK